MTNKPDPNAAAARLLRALEAPDPLTCEAARAQIDAFVEAEAAGQDVDADPAFADLLQHLDHCAECTTLYEELAADLDAALNPAEQPAFSPAPTFFKPARQSSNVIVTVIGALRQAFAVQLRLQLPMAGALSGGAAANLFADTLPEVAGAPLLAVSLVPGQAGEAPDVLVAVQSAASDQHWEILLATAESSHEATTDAQGIARFVGVPLADGEQIELSARALPT